MDPREFKNLAKELACSDSPVKMRTATSRAYYAAYLTGIDVLRKMGFDLEGFGGHGTLRDHLNNSGDVHVEILSGKLGDLHKDRIRADYRFYKARINSEIENPNTARGNVELAIEIIEALDACASDGSRCPQIVKAIQEYRNKLPAYAHKKRK